MGWTCYQQGCAVEGEHRHIAQWYDAVRDEVWTGLASSDLTGFLTYYGEKGGVPIVWENVNNIGPLGDAQRLKAALEHIREILGMPKAPDWEHDAFHLLMEAVVARLDNAPAFTETERAYQERLEQAIQALGYVTACAAPAREALRQSRALQATLEGALTMAGGLRVQS